MNLEKADILLDKINALHRSMQKSPADVANIEKDLMRNYIRQLYEAFLDTAPAPAQKAASKSKPVEIIKPAHKPKPPATQIANEKDDTEAPVEDEPEDKGQRAAKTPAEEIEKATSAKDDTAAPKIEEMPPSLRQITEDEADEKSENPMPETERDTTKTKRQPSKELEELFDLPGVRELSDKLGQMPIQDLTKAFGLNEKIFTINELFGGDRELFNGAIQKLNSLNNFDDARDYLCAAYAEKFNWAAKDKRKKAKEFIKLVRRRYTRT